jgi:hypothetical protein
MRTAVAAEQTVDAVYLGQLGRLPNVDERLQAAGALASGDLKVAAVIDTLNQSAEGQVRCWTMALPMFVTAGYVAPQPHFEQLVEIAFQAVFDRRPDPEALEAYGTALRSGRLSLDAFVAELISTPEAADRILSRGYLDQTGHLARLVDAAFLALLGRPPEDEARAAYTAALLSGSLTVQSFADELADTKEAAARVVRGSSLKDLGYLVKSEHYDTVVDVMFLSIIGRPADDAARAAFGGALSSGLRTPATAVEQLMSSDEVKLRVLNVGLPDVLEGIYRAVKGMPESDPSLQALIRSAVSRRTFETIKDMCLSAEAYHYIMRPIIQAHRQQFLDAAGAGVPVDA